jgi:hypothetical protein
MARKLKVPATIIRDLKRHTATLTVGARVWMPANADEGWNEERGKLLEVDYKHFTVMVELDEQYREGPRDDGLRETGAEFVRLGK